jgi:large subunit ribosomal protein L6
MSRIGKLPVPVPEGVKAQLEGNSISVKGPKGELSLVLMDEVVATLGDDTISLRPRDDAQRSRIVWGMQRTLVNNLVKGVSEGFKIELEINGVGYRAAVQGKVLNLQLGYSHDINYEIPDGIEVKCPRPTIVEVTGIDRQKVGQAAAQIRGYRKPEPYKGKGIKYSDEHIFRKEGKKK